MSFLKFGRMTVSALALGFFGFGSQAAAEPAALTSGADWSNDLTLYLFLPLTTKGTSTVAGTTADVDLSLSDALSVLDFAGSVRYEAWRNGFGLIVDGNYLGLSGDGELPGPGRLDVNVEVEQWWLGLLGAYRVAQGGTDRRYSADVQVGVRYNNLHQEIGISGGPGTGVTLGGTANWWEPVIGARYLWEINERWTGAVMGDVGGFGVNGSQLQWSASAGADYQFDNGGSLKLGLRYYSIDFSTEKSDGTFAYDVEQFGPFIGYTFRF